MCWTPSPQSQKSFYSKNEGGGCRPARPGELGSFHLKQPPSRMFQMGPGLDTPPLNWSVHPPFCVFGWFPSETSWNFTNYTLISVKHLKLVSKGPHIDKQLSPNEIRVWQYPHRMMKNMTLKELYLIVEFRMIQNASQGQHYVFYIMQHIQRTHHNT